MSNRRFRILSRSVLIGIIGVALVPVSALPVSALGGANGQNVMAAAAKPSPSIGTTAPGEKHVESRPAPAPGEVSSAAPDNGLQSVDLAQRPQTPLPVPKPPTTVGDSYIPGRSVEIPEKRGEKETIYQNQDGTQTAVFSSRPVHVKDSKGNWQNVDTSLEAVNGRIKNRRARVGLDFAQTANDRKLQSFQFSDGSSVDFALQGARVSVFSTSGNTITYSRALDDVDLSYTSQASGVQQKLVLRSASAADTYTFPMTLHGVVASMEPATGNIAFTNSKGDVVGRLTHGLMEDANVDPNSGQGALSDGVRLSGPDPV
jgi:large repetitive protein